jgi:CRISPR type IV-associated protein Csf3
MFAPLRVTFHLDGAGVSYDPLEPIMLDGIITAAVSRFHVHGEAPGRYEEPDEIPLPLAKWHIGDVWGWRASALLPDGEPMESLQYWRKRFRQGHVGLTQGSPNTQNGVYRDWNAPLPLLLAPRMVAYCVGDRKRLHKDLPRAITHIGRKRAYGKGRVNDIEIEEIDADYSLVRDGVAMRWLPTTSGTRDVRPRPPYWSAWVRVRCCEVGDEASAIASRCK